MKWEKINNKKKSPKEGYIWDNPTSPPSPPSTTQNFFICALCVVVYMFEQRFNHKSYEAVLDFRKIIFNIGSIHERQWREIDRLFLLRLFFFILLYKYIFFKRLTLVCVCVCGHNFPSALSKVKTVFFTSPKFKRFFFFFFTPSLSPPFPPPPPTPNVFFLLQP